MLIRGGGMCKKQPAQELIGGQRHGVGFPVTRFVFLVVIVVREANFAFRSGKQAGISNGTTMQVSGQVVGDALSVAVALLDADIPFDGLQLGEQLFQRGGAFAFGQAQLALDHGAAQMRQQARPKAPHQPLHRQQKAVLDGFPFAIMQSSAGDQAMHVGVWNESLAPGVQGHDDAGKGPEVTRVLKHGHQLFFDRSEQQVGHGLHI